MSPASKSFFRTGQLGYSALLELAKSDDLRTKEGWRQLNMRGLV
jgi:hypothetical protein